MSTKEQFEFSRQSLSRKSGNTSDDLLYLQWYARECANRIASACERVMELHDGRLLIDHTTVPALQGWMLSVGLHTTLLEEARDQFELKPNIARYFSEALERSTPPSVINSYAIPLLRCIDKST